MSDNKLLTENTIRRFMQLANTEAMTDSFLAENAPQKEKSPEEKRETVEEESADKHRNSECSGAAISNG